MNELTNINALMPVLPEIMLACGAMLMLMLGAFAGERSGSFVNGLCILLLIAVGAVVVWLPGGKTTLFGGGFVVDDGASGPLSGMIPEPISGDSVMYPIVSLPQTHRNP